MMKEIKLTDIKGVKVGQYENQEAATGCSVVIVENGATAGVDVRGGGPATRETDLLNPINMVATNSCCYVKWWECFWFRCS